MKPSPRLLLGGLLVLLLVGCSDVKPFIRDDSPLITSDVPPDHAEVVTFYALGDWGTGDENQKAVAQALREDVIAIPSGRKIAPFALGLGDNVYKKGLPIGWCHPEVVLLLDKTFGDIYADVTYQDTSLVFHVVPGNHDYAVALFKTKAWGDVFHLETTAEATYPSFKYYPIDHAAIADSDDQKEYDALRRQDPYEITLPEALPLIPDAPLTIVAIDTQVLLDLYRKKNLPQVEKHWRRLRELLEAGGPEDWKIVIGHHPVRTHGRHGGFTTLEEWIWSGSHDVIPSYLRPFTVIWGPVLLSLIDKLFVKHHQDTDDANNRRFRDALAQILKAHDALYLAGHDHSLQFLHVDRRAYQIVSGSAAKKSPVKHKEDTLFSHEALGFVRFDVTKTALWIQFYAVDVKQAGPWATVTASFKLTK